MRGRCHQSSISSLSYAIVFGALLVALLASPVHAATYYVEPGGDDNGPGSETQAFATPDGCINNMSGGDTCLIKNGTYNKNSPSNSAPAYNFCERDISGSQDSYTTIKNYPGHTPTIRSTLNSSIGVLKSAGRCEYYHFEGLRIEGGLTIRSDGSYGTSHIVVTNNEIVGGFDCDGNWSPVRIEDVDNMTFEYNYVHGYDSTGCNDGTGSSSLVKLFCVKNSVFQFNTLDDFDAVGDGPSHGFDDKDTTLNNTYRYNVIAAGGSEGIRVNHQMNCGPVTEDVFIYGNVFRGAGVRPLHDTQNIQIYNNTFTDSASGVFLGSSSGTPLGPNALVQDNLLADVNIFNWSITENTWDEVSGYTLDYNVYDPDGVYRERAYGSGDTTHTTLEAWRAATGKESHSVEAVCPFNEEFRPTGGACLTASSSGGEVGAYGVTSCVGHECRGPSAVECQSAPAEWLVCDGFDDGTLSYWDDVRAERLSVVSAGQTHVARVQHIAGLPTDDWAAKFFADHAELRSPGEKRDEIYVRLNVRFEEDFDFSQAVKLSIAAAFEDWNAGYPGPNPWAPFHATLYVSGSDPGAFKMEVARKTGGATEWRQFPQNAGGTVRATPGRWHEVQFHLELNTPGASDGVLEYWIDGVGKAVYTNVNFRDGYDDHGWNHLIGVSANTSGAGDAPATQTQDWDNIVCSTAFVVGDGTPPDPLPPPTVEGVARSDVLERP